MTFIANPIYDSVFKFMMEDDKVARLLLSAMLKKDIIELQMRQHEYSSMQENRISLFRMDFSAKIRENDGSEHLILIELQKTWLPTETLRFRQYLGTHYLSKSNMRNDDPAGYGLPIISIYILGHILGDIKEPVIYVRRRYLDYDDRVIEQKDPFVESLTHDSIIVQIPYLQGRTRNRLERLLNVFDQDYRCKDDEHVLEIDEQLFHPDELSIVTRLLKAGVAPNIRRDMDIEDEILSEIEKRDTVIMQRDRVIEQKEQMIEQKEQMLEQNKLVIEQQKNFLSKTIQLLAASGMSPKEIARQLSVPISEVSSLL